MVCGSRHLAPAPGRAPFGSSLSAPLACSGWRWVLGDSHVLAISSNPIPRPPRRWQSRRCLTARSPPFPG